MNIAPVPVIEVLASGPAEGGGIGRLMQYLLRANVLKQRLQVLGVIDPRGPGHWISSLWMTPAALVHLLVLRVRAPRGTALHVHIAGRLSTARKLPLIALGKFLGLRVVVHYHEYGYARFMNAQGAPVRAVIRWVLARADAHIVLGRHEASALPEALGAPIGRFHAIPTCVPPELLDIPRPAEDEVLQITFVGALSSRKGVETLFDSLERLNNTGVRNWRMVLCGGGDMDGRRALAHSHGLDAQCAFLGHVDEATVRRELARTHIFILPSHAEGLSVALLEAMAHGCAVVATLVGEQDAALNPGENALVAEPGDAAAFAAALQALLADRSLRARLGDQARQTIRNRFSSALVLDAIAEVMAQRDRRAASDR